MVIACVRGRVEEAGAAAQASRYGSVIQAGWSFQLAARARSLGTCWTTLHLMREKTVAEILGVPYETVQQLCLTPVAYTVGTNFRPAARPDPETIIRWDQW